MHRTRLVGATPPARDALPEIRASLGKRIRQARTGKGLSARALADAIGVTSGFISQLENGRVMPSVATLLALASELDLRIGDLFDGAPGAQRVLRREDRVEYEANPGVRDTMISLDPTDRLEVVAGTIDPACGSGDELYTHGAETEFVLVTRGTIVIFLDDEEIELTEGDSLTFGGDVPHGYINRGEESAQIIWVMTPATY